MPPFPNLRIHMVVVKWVRAVSLSSILSFSSVLTVKAARDSLPHRAAPNQAMAARAQITPGPRLLHDGRAVIAKRAYDLPDWLSSYSNVYSQIFLSDACSCLITSALPVA